MTNLKNKILNALNNNKQLEPTLNNLVKLQDNLLKNYSNPAFNEKDRDKLLKSYINLQNLGESLYRYNTLQEHNYTNEAQAERNNIEDIVLKGGISYCKYVWHSENGENTCDECLDLDGQVFDYYDDVSKRPHPNCKCYVEIVEGEIEPEDKDSEKDKKKIPPRVPIPQPPNPKPNPKPQPIPQLEIPLQTQKWIMPCRGRISSEYGWRIHPIYKTKKWHNGIDIANNQGTIIKAPADGKVYYAGYESQWNGNTIRINHGFINGIKVESVYIHLQGFNIKSGDTVKQGQIIGFMGSTGNSTGPHLHFSIYENKRGNDVNPFKYIDKSKY